MTTRHAPCNCVTCGHDMDASSHMEDDNKVPKDGDVALCIKCATPYELRNNKWELMTTEEISKLPEDIILELAKMKVAIIITQLMR